MIRFFQMLFLKGHEWCVICEPSLFPSGCWADKELWGQTFYFPSFWKAWLFGKRYCGEHPYGRVNIHFRPLPKGITA